jgi:hypothetical protein
MMRFRQTLWVGAWALLAAQAPAQERDPTRAPAEMNAAPVSALKAQSPLGENGMTVLVRDGKPFLVSATRLYAQGDRLGQYKIERITETEVWLRDGKDLLKFPRFTGIQRRAAATERPTP